ncbi:endonuclease/exonuclease/phosphatase family protein [uncultured Chryseobacterium sp.]|uniref:endonuclease/exonuclease/phosphatase family protein n=1 Tax=uncultured Chryseobacterium sp. TaxID=259322 RepID=UPI0025DCA9FE|nr:endonuclease/exonuclease/phosphatase family protein [uncultured Chryseobacterium sp.]
MKIATYNVNGVNGRLPVLIRWLKEADPHIVCLQELKAPQEKFPEKAILDTGYRAIWKGQKSWNGMASLPEKTWRLPKYRGNCAVVKTMTKAGTFKPSSIRW